MIYVTQGHEKGIGLEIFLKSFLLLPIEKQRKVALVVFEETFKNYLKLLNFKESSFKNLTLHFVSDLPTQSSSSLEFALQNANTKDLLITLPTSKDQLIYQGKNCAGYTEFFRAYYNDRNIAMCFKGVQQNVLLITDHVNINQISKNITEDLIINKTQQVLDCYEKYFHSLDEVIFSGINPHVGENGVIGSEDKVIMPALEKLKKSYPQKSILGPFSGDTLHMHENALKNQLLVYMFHDQGLSAFKAKHGLIGINVTMGLPFLRLSVDHGTAFDLYGKNVASVSGMIFLFNHAFEVLKRCQSTK